MSEKRETATIHEWISSGGGVSIRTDALDHDHPMHPYNQLLDQGVKPEDFGYEHPLTERFKDQSRSELINRIIELEKELNYAARMGI